MAELTRFAMMLRDFRVASDMSVNTLARKVHIDPSYVSRMERAERDPCRREILLNMCHAMNLAPEDADSLMACAGYAPECLQAAVQRIANSGDPALRAVQDVLDDERFTIEARQLFRNTIVAIAEHWGYRPVAELVGRPVSIQEALSTVAYTDDGVAQ